MPIIWGRWMSEHEVQQLARELDQIGRDIEKKTEGIAKWIQHADKLKARNPHGKIF